MRNGLIGNEGRVATDIGGTFTDLFYGENGQARSLKCPSTPGRFEEGIANAILESGIDLSRVEYFAHGSTVVINALMERKGVKTGLITTRGFRDVLEIARGNTPDIFNSYYRKPPPFVPRHLRQEVSERIDHRGEVVVPLDEKDLACAVRRLDQEGVRAIAVCFLHAYANPAHERRALQIIADAAPEVEVIASHEVCLQWREYERTSTTVLSAYILPTTRTYLDRLQGNLTQSGFRYSPLIMQSNGGLVGPSTAAANPISLVESGPVAGVLGSAAYGRKIGEFDLVTLDIGGTTAKCSLVRDGEARITTEYHIERTPKSAGYPISTPVVDIVEIGNGGGSIAWLDKVGSLHVGPQSAGADPGPVAYGRGGLHPTTTDAHLLLGRIDPRKLAGSDQPPDLAAINSAFDVLAGPLGVEALDAALGTVRIANANMVNALKLVSLNRGHDPRDLSLIAFGGAAGLHASTLARELEIPKVVIPPHSSVFSAWAMITLDRRRDHIVTRIRELNQGCWQWVMDTFADMEQDARRQFAIEMVAAGEVGCRYFLDLRYCGQEHSVKVLFKHSEDDVSGLLERFHSTHEREFAFRLEHPVEIVNFHVTIFAPPPELAQVRQESIDNPDSSITRIGSRSVYFDGIGDGKVTAPVYERSGLSPGVEINGPAIIEEPDSVTLVPPDTLATVDRYGGLHLHMDRV